MTLKPIEGLFLSEFGLPENVQSQYANIVLAARMKREEAPEPLIISAAEFSDMDLGRCSLPRPPQRAFGPGFYIIACLSLVLTAVLAAVGGYCCANRPCLGSRGAKKRSQFIT